MKANRAILGINLRDQAVAWLRERLPRGWSVEDVNEAGNPSLTSPADKKVSLRGPNGTITTIAVEEKESVSPRTVLTQLVPRVQTARNMGGHLPLLVIVPWLSRRTQELLAEQEISYIDLTGNALLRIDNPPFYLQTEGAVRNPAPPERGSAQLRGAKAARLIRLLIDVTPPYGVRELAAATGLAPGYVSRLLDTLDREAFIERVPRGPVENVDAIGLLRRWANSYDVFDTNEPVPFIASEGIDRLLPKLIADPEVGTKIAITGSLAANRLAPVASPSLFLAYYEAPGPLTRELGLLPAEEGANVIFLQPFDPVVFDRTSIENGLRYASPAQVAVDCLTGNGRMPAEGEAILQWMQKDELTWRIGSIKELSPRFE